MSRLRFSQRFAPRTPCPLRFAMYVLGQSERERERERESEWVCVRQKSVCECVYVSDGKSVCVCEEEMGQESVRACVDALTDFLAVLPWTS
jgi:hypothetical protein